MNLGSNHQRVHHPPLITSNPSSPVRLAPLPRLPVERGARRRLSLGDEVGKRMERWNFSEQMCSSLCQFEKISVFFFRKVHVFFKKIGSLTKESIWNSMYNISYASVSLWFCMVLENMYSKYVSIGFFQHLILNDSRICNYRNIYTHISTSWGGIPNNNTQ